MCCVSFDLPYNLCNAYLWVDVQEQMYVIRHDLHIQDLRSVFFLLFQDEFLQTGINTIRQYPAPIFGTEDDVILTTIHK